MLQAALVADCRGSPNGDVPGALRPHPWRRPARRRFEDPADAIEWLRKIYRRDRTEGQKFQTWVLYEKATLGAQIEAWTWDYGLPTAALRGYSTESLEREIFDAMTADGRPVVVFYVGDLDPEGEDIERNFMRPGRADGRSTSTTGSGSTVLPAQIGPLGLVPNPGKADVDPCCRVRPQVRAAVPDRDRGRRSRRAGAAGHRCDHR